MSLGERIKDSLSALTLKNYHGTVHTRGGVVGGIREVRILKGQVIVETPTGTTTAYPGRDVADIDTPLMPSHPS